MEVTDFAAIDSKVIHVWPIALRRHWWMKHDARKSQRATEHRRRFEHNRERRIIAARGKRTLARAGSTWAAWLATRPENVRKAGERFKPWLDYQFKDTKRLCYIRAFSDHYEGGPVTLKVLQPDLFGMVDHEVFGVGLDDIELADETCVRPL